MTYVCEHPERPPLPGDRWHGLECHGCTTIVRARLRAVGDAMLRAAEAARPALEAFQDLDRLGP